MLGILTSSLECSKLLSSSLVIRSRERIKGDGDEEDGSYNCGVFNFGDIKELPSLDNTVRGTTRGDGEAEENGDDAADIFTLVLELDVSSLPLG
mmetsp:Transcript_30333/g.51684  ORF Transcript_30333/g.51684 Transcript_30333/m.51684 type:complete len:94 (-) Transcript_30333:1053-1334(-)